MSTEVEIVSVVDASGLRCPMPLLRAKQALNQVLAGQSIKVIATDPGSVRDFHSFSRLSGNPIVSFREVDQVFEYVMSKKRESAE